MLSGNAEGIEQDQWRSGAWKFTHGKHFDNNVTLACDCTEYSFTNTTLGVVVFHDDNTSTTFARVLDYCVLVDGFDREQIQNTHVDSGLCQLRGGSDGFLEGYSSTDEEDLISGGLADDVSLTNL